MGNNEIQIRLIVKDELSKALKKAEKNTGSSVKKMQKSFVELAAKMYLVVSAVKTIGRVAGTFISAASKVESLHTRMEVLFNSVEIGNQVFEDMAKLAANVPKTYDEIMESATNLAGVVKKGPEELNKLMPIIVDISSATGLGVQETTSQIIRMYSAGAAAADMFRERGISAALGFQAGVSYTNEETMDILVKQWEDGTGKFVGASEALKDDWVGKVSMMQDAWFNFTAVVGEGIIKSDNIATFMDSITEGLKQTTEAIRVIGEDSLNLGDILKATFNVGFYEEMFGIQDSLAEKMFVVGESTNIASDAIQEQTELLAELNVETSLAAIVNEQDTENRIKLLKKLNSLQTSKIKLLWEEDKLVLKITKDNLKKDKLGVEGINQYFGALSAALKSAGAEHKAMARAAAVIDIGLAVMNTAVGISRALAEYKYPLSIVVGALVAAAGAVQIAAISSQGFAEGTDTVPSMLSPGEMVVPRTFAGAIRSGDLTLGGRNSDNVDIGREINIYITNPIIREDDDINALGEELGFRVEEMLRIGRG